MLHMILLVFAFVLSIVEACRFWQQSWPFVPNLGWLGLALYFLALILGYGTVH